MVGKLEITEEVVKDSKALTELLNVLVNAIFEPGGHVAIIREDAVLTKNVVNALIGVLLQNKVVKKKELQIEEWLPLGETISRLDKIRKTGMQEEGK